MLTLKNIIKEYKTGFGKVLALKGVNLDFRRNEFVSVLGPSGCGKTTLLNIIGGLDHYTSGDLLIDGKSTKAYKDRDWDIYRNHRVGFVFQSYNLIPHQTILGNVELALTIAGMSKDARTEKAKAALDKVGLSDQCNKRPNQLSGGQMQRVAIARALVNDPEILLADEPTGALDTKTSKQIMNLIKEIAKERLVIMVTHNSELADEYSTRIIRLLDGNLQSDSNPFSKEDKKEEEAIRAAEIKAKKQEEESEIAAAKASGNKIKKIKKQEKAKMSFWTSFKLSLQNLFSKKKRTIMTSIAGSIGIIGVSMVLALSYGIQGFINKMQNDMLSGNPIGITKTAIDLNAMMQGMSNNEKLNFAKENGWVNVDKMVASLAARADTLTNIFIDNVITPEYVHYVQDIPEEHLSALHLDYGLDVSNNIFAEFIDRNGTRQLSLSAIRAIYGSILEETDLGEYATLISGLDQSFLQMPDAEDYVLSQYNLLHGDGVTSRVAKEKREVMIVLGDDRTLADLLLAQLGYYTQEEFLNIVYKATPKANGSPNNDYKPELDVPEKISYSELINKTFTWYPNDDVFENVEGQILDPSDVALNTTRPFRYNPNEPATTNGIELEIVGILEPKKDLNYGMLDNGFYYTKELAEYIINENKSSEIADYFNNKGIDSFTSGLKKDGNSYTMDIIDYIYEYSSSKDTSVIRTAETGMVGSQSAIASMIASMFSGGEDMPPSATITLQELGCMYVSGMMLPNSILIYPKDFKHKDAVLTHLDKWNSDEDIEINGTIITAGMREEITYTDTLSIIISMIKNLVQIITIALVGFTSLALVVSCVMIAIITYVSVVERIKEIGVIRSLGGRKRDVANLFIAETFIIGFASGMFGVIVTYIFSGIINLIVGSLTMVKSIAVFPLHYALIMVSISVLLTLISGLMPSQSAAKKDPAVALRTE